MQVSDELFHVLLLVVPRLNIALELAATEYPIHRNREVGECVQADAPGNRALSRPVVHDRMDRGKKTERVEEKHDQGQHGSLRRHQGGFDFSAMSSSATSRLHDVRRKIR